MVGVFVLHLKMSGSSDSSIKARVIYLVLLIVVIWRRVNQPTLKTPFFI